MRHKGDENEFKRQQDREVMDAYRRIFSMYGGKVSVRGLYELVAFSPTSHFFVSEGRALAVIGMMRNGKQLPQMREGRMKMYFEIYQRTRDVMMDNPRMSLADAVTKVVNMPAPEMYLSARQVSAIITKEKKLCFEKKRQRLLRSS